jgi:hypothetical protein
MNNEKQLKDLQKTIDDAQKQIQELMDQKDDFEFSAGFHFVRDDCTCGESSSQRLSRAAGAEFETSEFATYAAKMRLRQNIMLKAAERFNPEGWEPDFNSRRMHFFIYCYESPNVSSGSFDVDCNDGHRKIETVYFASRKAAEAAIPFIKYHMEKLDK